MLNGLMAAINAEADANPNFKVRATSVNTVTNGSGNEVAQITIKSTHRGDELTGKAVSFNFSGSEQTETGSEVSITSSRVAEAGDQVRIRRFIDGIGEDPTAQLTFTQGLAGENGFTTFAELATKINNHSSDKYVATLSGSTIKITDKNPESTEGIANPSDTNNADGTDRVQRVRLTVTQGQTDYVTNIQPFSTTRLFADKGDTFTDRATGKVGGGSTNSLNVDFNITKATGVVNTASLAVGSNAGSGMAIGDQFTVAGTEIGDTDGNSITFRVDSVAGKASTASSVGTQKGKVASDNYTNTGIATTGGGNNDFALDITSQDNGTITKAQTSISAGTGYSFGDTLSISAADLGGGNAVAGQITVTEVDGGVGGGPGVITNYTWDSGSARSNNLATTYNAVTTAKVGGAGDNNLTLNITTDATGTITGATVNASGLNYAIGDTVEVTAASLGTTGANRTFTVSGINGEVTGFSHVSGQAQSSWSVTGTESTINPGSNLSISATAGRDGVMTVTSIDNGGQDYTTGNNKRLNFTGDGVVSNNLRFDITSIQSDLSDAKTTNLNSGGITTTDAERGDQFIADGSDDISFTEVATAAVNNVIGENRVRTVTINADKKIGGTGNDTDRIHVGDEFSITVTEVLHTDEQTGGGWPEGNTNNNTHGENPGRTAHQITVSVTADVNDDENSIATKLKTAYDTQRIATVTMNSLAGDDLPTVVDTGNTLTFTSGREGEDFQVTWNQNLNPDVITATGAVNDPSGSQSHVGNISPFSITKSLNYFSEMLAQNAAETNRLTRDQEHLENSMVNTEQAWGKLTDADYAKASTEQLRASMKMEMANSIIGKSIHMNDLLVDLTTKHHRGAILNANV